MYNAFVHFPCLPVAHEEGEVGFYRDARQNDSTMCIAVGEHLGHQHVGARQVLGGATALAQAAVGHLQPSQLSIQWYAGAHVCVYGLVAVDSTALLLCLCAAKLQVQRWGRLSRCPDCWVHSDAGWEGVQAGWQQDKGSLPGGREGQ